MQWVEKEESVKDVKNTYIEFSVKIKWNGDHPMEKLKEDPHLVRYTFLKEGVSFNIQELKILSVEVETDVTKTEDKRLKQMERSIGSTILKDARKHLPFKIKIGPTARIRRATYAVSFEIITDEGRTALGEIRTRGEVWERDMVLIVNTAKGVVQLSLHRVHVRNYHSYGKAVQERAYKKKVIKDKYGSFNPDATTQISYADPECGKKVAKEIEKLVKVLS
jgi:hypothetical protein